MTAPSGILILDKPAGISSARAVDRVKRLLPRGTKIGHAGTLDPFATGVLLLLVGKATKQCEALMGQRKGYEATVKFGATTPTEDPESPEQPWPGAAERGPAITLDQVRAAAAPLVGQILQRPPAFSALKIAGRRAYDLARAGTPVAPEPRQVMVYSLEILDFAWPTCRLRMECGRGTYVRSLARDLGEALDVGAYLTQLRRTFIGAHPIDQSVTLDRLQTDGITPHLIPLAQ
ncbi:MAG: tRNA pseudouridine(55) synthase TruB [Phycisphaerae bacterium]|nr:tRNA pseudouridine(55) synthase TruB [Tepidisphaeraceae bacterium]